MKLKKVLAFVLTTCVAVSSLALGSISVGSAAGITDYDNDNDLLLWYTESARTMTRTMDGGYGTENEIWQQNTLPIGNGYMGATIYGEVAREEMLLNEKTLWEGGPSTSRPNYDGGNIDKTAIYEQIVAAFQAGDNATASNLCAQLVGEGSSGGYGEYEPFGTLYIDFGFSADNATNYIRTLDLNTAISTVEFDYNGNHYKREYFMSYPDNVMVVKLTTDGSLTCTTTLPSLQGGTSSVNGDTITTKGAMADNQMRYNGKVRVVNDGGTIAANVAGTGITVTGANSITMYVAMGTDYENTYPTYRTGEDDAAVDAKVAAFVDDAYNKGYDNVLASHLADYQEIFGRVSLDLGQEAADIPTNELLASYKSGAASDALKSELEVMLFQYGRYLTLASSRDGSLPSNLQGVWQNRTSDAPWASDYHMNVNLQMNYWPTYSTNMAECATPLIDYVDSLREPGRVTAANYFGIVSEDGEENGFTANTQNTPFGWTCPGWTFSWGWSPAAVPWILQNCWEYYEFTGDVDYMAKNIYPMMLEECKLYTQILTWDEEGQRYVTAPSYSPEHGPYTFGNTYESSLVWQMFTDTITAAEVLGTDTGADKDIIDTIKDMVTKLNPIEIGDSGQIKEWFGDEEGEIGKTASGSTISGYDSYHRHLSHMLGLFPGDLIQTNAEWIEAARVSMENRPDQSTGWGMGQRINTWARLGDGNKAYELINYLFNSGIYSNLWDTHKPFQIDGNFGMTSGVAEMLLQSNMGYIDILPAIPDAWDEGSYSGLVARGDFEISVDWKYGMANKIRILSQNGGECIVSYTGIDNSIIKDSAGQAVNYTVDENGMAVFNTTAGETYTVTGLPTAAPKNVTATISKGNRVTLTWDAIENATYTVYKKVGTGEFTAIATDVKEANYFDTYTASETPTDFIYVVTATVNGGASERSNEAVPDYPSEIVKLDNTRMTATACSQYSNTIAENTDGAAGSVIDGNYNTFWHTNWSSDISLNNDHHWIKVDLGGTYNISRIDFTPRQNSPNGRLTTYDLYITNAKGSEELVIDNGTMANDTSTKIIELPQTYEATAIRFQYVAANSDAAGTHGTCAEIEIYQKINIDCPNGDVDRSTIVDGQDVSAIQKYIAKISEENFDVSLADTNLDRKVNIKDATLIQKYIIGEATIPEAD